MKKYFTIVKHTIFYVICIKMMTQCNSVEDFMDIPDNSDGFECEIAFIPLFNEKNILRISSQNYEYGFGGAHPNSWTSFVNFDLRTENIIRPEEVVVDEFLRPLSLMAKKRYWAIKLKMSSI